MAQVAPPETVVGDFDGTRVDAVPGRPIALARLVRKLLAKRADRRYQTATAVRKALLLLSISGPVMNSTAKLVRSLGE